MIQNLQSDVVVKAVIFDLFGTLVKGFSAESYEEMLRRMSEILDVSVNDFFQKWRAKFRVRVAGEYISLHDHLLEIGKELGKTFEFDLLNKALESRKLYLKKALEPRSESASVINLLQENKYLIGVLTDCSDPVPELWKAHCLAHQVDTVVFSCETGTKKPDKYLYDLVCTGLKLKNSECLYVGDGGSRELFGAFSAGLTPIRLDVNTFSYERDTFQAAKADSLTDISTFLCK